MKQWIMLAGAIVTEVAGSLSLKAALGIWGAVGVALTALLSTLIFGEALTPVMLIGIGLVIAGVLCVELGRHPRPKSAPTTAEDAA